MQIEKSTTEQLARSITESRNLTISDLSLEGLPEGAYSALVDHLKWLLTYERLLLSGVADSTGTPAETPWYPDDSGEWVETYGQDPGLAPGTKLCLLLISERRAKAYKEPETVFVAGTLATHWASVVAYKVVKPCA